MSKSTTDAKDATRAGGLSSSGAATARAAAAAEAMAAALSERFTILELLESSGDVKTYLARDKEVNSLVRLRVLSAQAAREPWHLELFKLEARAASQLSHKNILRATEAVALGGFHFYTTEHKENAQTLGRLIERKGWLDIPGAVGITLQIADALEHAHERGVVHLKLAPEKILLDETGAAIITDFGIGEDAGLAWAHRERSHQLGPQYLSPEQVIGAKLNHRSDLYSLGVMLYEMLTDRAPFDANDPESIRRKHSTQLPVPPHQLLAHVPVRLSRAVMSLLEKNPDERCGKAADVKALVMRSLDYNPEPPASTREVTATAIDDRKPEEGPSEVKEEIKQEPAPRAEAPLVARLAAARIAAEDTGRETDKTVNANPVVANPVVANPVTPKPVAATPITAKPVAAKPTPQIVSARSSASRPLLLRWAAVLALLVVAAVILIAVPRMPDGADTAEEPAAQRPAEFIYTPEPAATAAAAAAEKPAAKSAAPGNASDLPAKTAAAGRAAEKSEKKVTKSPERKRARASRPRARAGRRRR